MSPGSRTRSGRARAPQGLKKINAAAVGVAFLGWCVSKGWLVQGGNEYFATDNGMRELKKHFGIEV